MGLDMTLHATKYVRGTDWTRNADGTYSDWDNADYDTAIGSIGLDRSDINVNMPSVNIEIKVAEWRKANAIHQWFVDNVQGGEDNCRDYYVSRDDLEELLATLGKALEIRKHQDDDMVDPTADETIEDILPTAEGFFFGSTEYDDYYWQEVEQTYELINNLLTNPKFGGFDFNYSSSW